MALHLSLLKVATGLWTAIVFIMMKDLCSLPRSQLQCNACLTSGGWFNSCVNGCECGMMY